MLRRVEVITGETDLERQAWVFWYGDRGAELDAWRHERRKTKRHAWRSHQLLGEVWTRLNARDNRCVRPTPPKRVIAAALQMFADSLKYIEEDRQP